MIKVGKKKCDVGINVKRLELLNKGFLTLKDIKEFVPCGTPKAREIYNSIRQEVEMEGLENCDQIILAKRILKFMGLTATDIRTAAKTEVEIFGYKEKADLAESTQN